MLIAILMMAKATTVASNCKRGDAASAKIGERTMRSINRFMLIVSAPVSSLASAS